MVFKEGRHISHFMDAEAYIGCYYQMNLYKQDYNTNGDDKLRHFLSQAK